MKANVAGSGPQRGPFTGGPQRQSIGGQPRPTRGSCYTFFNSGRCAFIDAGVRCRFDHSQSCRGPTRADRLVKINERNAQLPSPRRDSFSSVGSDGSFGSRRSSFSDGGAQNPPAVAPPKPPRSANVPVAPFPQNPRSRAPAPPSQPIPPCSRCGGRHHVSVCRWVGECHVCGGQHPQRM